VRADDRSDPINDSSDRGPGEGDPFAASMRCGADLAGMHGGDGAMGMDHAELEDVIAERGREFMRRLLQHHLDLRAALRAFGTKSHGKALGVVGGSPRGLAVQSSSGPRRGL
jgi:hypothetical protein